MKRYSIILIILLLALVWYHAEEQEVPELLWKAKTRCSYDNVFTLHSEITVKDQLFSTYCSITNDENGLFSGTLSFSMPGIRAGVLSYTSIAYLMFNPTTNTAIQYNSPLSAFSATVDGALYGYALGQNAGFYSLYKSQDTLITPLSSGFWIQKQCTSSVIFRFITGYGEFSSTGAVSWINTSTMPSIWSVLGLISQGSAMNGALVYGLRRGIDNSFGWFIRAQSTLNFTIATITADTAVSNGMYHTPTMNNIAIMSVSAKTTLFPQSMCSFAFGVNHIQKTLLDEPKQAYSGSFYINGLILKGKLSAELVTSQTNQELNLFSSIEYKPIPFQVQSQPLNHSRQPLIISLATRWKTINTQAEIFSITGLIEYEHFMTMSIAIKTIWDTQGSRLYFDPKISIPFFTGSITGVFHFLFNPETYMPELQKLEFVFFCKNKEY
ncbi:MAG TPA: hypothetical protein P5519_05335 [Spirochaetia bacterium]|nr:hypothetical protein [Spirochaetales bacterium]HPD80209.1 hypothetical protein [Spirochaetales bacterium]HQK35650.1 hypothetical protein [Spirochaetales bacterium]HRS65294.1 hypothetical protein [Spirochaetia bacterium]HRV27794.1 hypothetical protein [Spirochaetia bacterium]